MFLRSLVCRLNIHALGLEYPDVLAHGFIAAMQLAGSVHDRDAAGVGLDIGEYLFTRIADAPVKLDFHPGSPERLDVAGGGCIMAVQDRGELHNGDAAAVLVDVFNNLLVLCTLNISLVFICFLTQLSY